MKILIVSYSDTEGGAAKAAYRLLEMFLKKGHNCNLLVAEKKRNNKNVVSFYNKKQSEYNRVKNYFLQYFIRKFNKFPNKELNTLAISKTKLKEIINASDADIILLTWIGWEMISVKDISLIKKNIVWRLSDMWVFNGSSHYDPDNIDSQWKINEPILPLISLNPFKLNFNGWTLKRKLKYWKNTQFNIVVPSSFTGESCTVSKIGNKWPVTKIPTPVNQDIFKYCDPGIARQLLSLDTNRKYILFVANEVFDYRKGFEFFVEAINLAYRDNNKITPIVIGKINDWVTTKKFEMEPILIGRLQDELSMSLYYKACDMLIISSRADNLPLAGVEAQFCGCPIITFDIPGLRDLIDKEVHGCVVENLNSTAIANAITELILLHEKDDNCELRIKLANDRLVNYGVDTIYTLYKQLFESIDKSRWI